MLEPNSVVSEEYGACHSRNGEVIAGVRIEVGGRKVTDTLFGNRFNDCVVRLKSGSWTSTILRECKFEDCLIWPARMISSGTWNADFLGCKFKGRWSTRIDGRFEDCDLSEAKIDYLALISSAGTGTIWPAFPHVVLQQIHEHYLEWRETPVLKDLSKAYIGPRVRAAMVIMDLSRYFDDPKLAWEQLKDKPWAFRAD